MAVIILIISLIQVFILDQMFFWGATPMVWAIFTITFKEQYSWHEMLRWGAVFSLVTSTLHNVNPLIHLLAVIGATLAALIGMRLFVSIKVFNKNRPLQLMVVTASYVVVEFFISGVAIYGRLFVRGLLSMVLMTIVLNFVLSYLSLRMSKQLKAAR